MVVLSVMLRCPRRCRSEHDCQGAPGALDLGLKIIVLPAGPLMRSPMGNARQDCARREQA